MDVLILYSIPIFLISIALELALVRRQHRAVYEWNDSLACIAMGLGNVVISAIFKFAVLGLLFVPYHFRLFTIPADAWWAWVLLFFGDDLCFYAFHRAHHRVRLLWCTHVNHHSSQRFNLAVALRQPWTQPLTAPWFWLPLPLLGFHPLMVMTQMAASLLYQFFLHTEVVGRLGPLEWVLNTPSHHRVHHGTNPQYLDKNYGGILIIWDRLFGSFEPEGEPARYGLTKNIHTYNPVKIAFHEWLAMFRDVLSARGWRARWRAAAAPPATAPG